MTDPPVTVLHMTTFRRRDLLIGATAALTGTLLATPAPAFAVRRRTASTMSYDPSYKTAHLYQYGNPTHWRSLTPGTGAVIQDIAVTTKGEIFTTQAGGGSNGTSTPYQSTVISRLDGSTGAFRDAMRLTDAGHGIGLEVEYDTAGQVWILLTWRGASTASGGRENDYVRFRYTPNSASPPGATRTTVNARDGLQVLPIQTGPEMLVKVDEFRGWAVCKHYDSNGFDTFVRRKLDEMKTGVGATYGRITLPISSGTLQGFATINDTLFRYMGAGASGGVMSSTDPIAIEEFDWNTGQQIARHTYPTLGQDSSGRWRDGYAEPEGMTSFREPDGHESLVIGLVTGTSSGHRWDAYKFTDIGI